MQCDKMACSSDWSSPETSDDLLQASDSHSIIPDRDSQASDHDSRASDYHLQASDYHSLGSGNHSQVSEYSQCSHDAFSEVLSVLRLDLLPAEAARIRRARTHQDFSIDQSNWSYEDVSDDESVYHEALEWPSDEESCEDGMFYDAPVDEDHLPTIGSPVHGSFNILFPIEFSDGEKWMVKVPQLGIPLCWHRAHAQELTSEALTMRILRQQTTIPVPEVYAFSADNANALGCPYILMEFLPGKNLYYEWYNSELSEAELQSLRQRVLEQLAAAMAQLDRFSFTLGGRIKYNKKMEPVGIAPVVQGGEWEEGVCFHVFEAGPFLHPRDWYNAKIDRNPFNITPDYEILADMKRGEDMFCKLFVDCVMNTDTEGKKFVLTHPDLDIQNILVSSDGTLTGLFDWDGVAAWPKSIGNRRYPSWLTADWNPGMDPWRTGLSSGDPPEELQRCRKIYYEAMKKFTQGDSPETLISLITENLEQAMTWQGVRRTILDLMFEKMNEVGVENLELNMPRIYSEYGSGELDDLKIDLIRKRFAELLKAENL